MFTKYRKEYYGNKLKINKEKVRKYSNSLIRNTPHEVPIVIKKNQIKFFN